MEKPRPRKNRVESAGGHTSEHMSAGEHARGLRGGFEGNPESHQELSERKQRMAQGVIIETKVSWIRRAIELCITIFFNLVIIWLIATVIDAIYTMIFGHHLWFNFLASYSTEIGWYGALILPSAIVIFYVAASIWLWFKHSLYDPQESATEPAPVRNQELADFFQLPLEEIERRQNADELVISENIDNERMVSLRRDYAKAAAK